MKELWNFEFENDIVIELNDGTIIYCDGDEFVSSWEDELQIKPNKRTKDWPWPFIDEKDGLPITYFFVTPDTVKDIYFYKDRKKQLAEIEDK